jgi:predicted RND superfamily exporter protein
MEHGRRAGDEQVAVRATGPLPAPRLTLLIEELARLQMRRPSAFLWFGLAVSLIGLLLCTRLTLRTRFEDLLPERSPSVIELGRLMRETERGGQIFVLLEGASRTRLRESADALAALLRDIGPPAVSAAESGVHEARRFLLPRAGLFAGVAELERIDGVLRDRIAWEVGEALGMNLDDPPPRLDLDEMLTSALAPPSLGGLARRFPDGYYEDGSDPANVVVVKTSVPGGDLEQARSVLGRVQQRVAEVLSAPEHSGVRARFAGDLVTGLAEYGAAQQDLLDVGALGLCLVLGVVLLYFMRVRVLLLMALAIAAGLSWTFGCTALWFGHINLASGSLISLVTGSSINHGIIFMARYFEERTTGLDPERSVQVAHAQTAPATLTAALAGAAAYGCLAAGDFPLLDHFALVGALGMFLCWLSTLLLLGPALLYLERWWPITGDGGAGALQRFRLGRRLRLRHGFRLRYEQPFAFLVSRFARPIALGGGALAVVGLCASVQYARAWPTEHDMRRLQNDLGESSELYAASKRCASILGAAIESSMVVLADRPDQVPALKSALELKRDATASDEKPFEAVHTLFDFVPAEQPRKLSLLSSIRSRLLHLKAHATEEQWQRVESLLPAADLVPFGVDDLPAEVAAPFTDRNGVRGRIALIEPAAGQSDSDLRYLVRWANSFRETHLPNGEVVHGSGRAVVFADMLQAVQSSTPRTLSLSLCMTTLVVAVLFRGLRGTLLVFAALFTGLVWLGLMMSAGGVRLNFMNFIALPVTFGIAVDYPVNFLTRLHSDPRRDVLRALRGTGGAIILCSLTTLLGYTALLASVNQAIRSLGLLCVLGELACVTAATLLLPAVLVWRKRSRGLQESRRDPLPASS